MGTGDIAAELASLPAGSRHGVGRKLSGPEEKMVERNLSPVNLLVEKKQSPPVGVKKVSSTPVVPERKLSPVNVPVTTERTPATVERKPSPTDSIQRKLS